MRVIAEVVKAVDDVDLSVGALKFHLLGDYIGLLWLKPTAQKRKAILISSSTHIQEVPHKEKII